MAQLPGKVTGPKASLLTTVHALNADKNVDFMVLVVDGEYPAVTFAGLPNEPDRKALIVYLQKMTGAK